MQPEIRTRPDKTILYVRRTGNYNKTATEAWSALCEFAGPRGLLGRNTECLGIGHEDPAITAEDKLRYDACITVDGDVKPEGEVGKTILQGGLYAVFMHKGPYNRLNDTYQAIYKDWMPSSRMKLRDCACFELYLDDVHRTKPENLRTEIWVPVD